MKLDKNTNHVSKAIKEFNRQCAQEKSKRSSNHAHKYSKHIQNYGIDMSCKIGQGTFSKVYKGKNMQKHGEVAVKIVQLKKIREMGIEQLFWEELNIIKRLRHPNIVLCYEYFRTNNNCYTIYELCQGGDLASRIKKGNLGEKEDIHQANSIMKDVFQGLLYLESISVVHRDIKAANILLSKGKAKIGDFGFATHCKKQFKDVSIGSPAYMAPEGLVHNIYGPKTDVWAFGILIYQILHGQTPFHNCQSEKQLKQRVHIPVSWDQLKCSLPSQLKRLILKCLKVQFQQRPSFSQLLNDQYIQKIYHQSNSYRNNTSKSNFSKLTSDSESIIPPSEKKVIQQKSSNPLPYYSITQRFSINTPKKASAKFVVKTQNNEDDQTLNKLVETNEQLFLDANQQQKNNLKVQQQIKEQRQDGGGRIFENLPVSAFIILKQASYTQQELQQYMKIIHIFKGAIKSHRELIQQQNIQFFPQFIQMLVIELYCKADVLGLSQLKQKVKIIVSKQSMPQGYASCDHNAKDMINKLDEQLFKIIKAIQLQIDHQSIDASDQKYKINESEALIKTGNLMIICLQIVYNINHAQIRNNWIKNYQLQLTESEQFYIWLYELQLRRLQVSQI